MPVQVRVSENGRTTQVAQRIPDPGPHYLSDQQFARRHASRCLRPLRDYADSWASAACALGKRAGGIWPYASATKSARSIRAAPGEISLHQNVTLTQAVNLVLLRFLARHATKSSLLDLEFPSIHLLLSRTTRHGARVEIVPSSDRRHPAPMARLLAAIDETTLLVPISLVSFAAPRSWTRAPSSSAPTASARMSFSMCFRPPEHSVDLHALSADFAVGGVLKWLCGGPGVAYLYVRPRPARKRLTPSLTGWIAHRRPSLSRPAPSTPVTTPSAISTARRTSPRSTPANRAWKLSTRPASPQSAPIPFNMTSAYRKALGHEAGASIRRDNSSERGGTVSIDCPHACEVCNANSWLAISSSTTARTQAVRLSPHFYNRDEEIRFAIEQIDEILRTQAPGNSMARPRRLNSMSYLRRISTSNHGRRLDPPAIWHRGIRGRPTGHGRTTNPPPRRQRCFAVLAAMASVARHLFVPAEFRQCAYETPRCPSAKARQFPNLTSSLPWPPRCTQRHGARP